MRDLSFKTIFKVGIFILPFFSSLLFANNTFALNQWVDATLPATLSSDMKFNDGKRYVWSLPIELQKGKKYTFIVKWKDGDGRTVLFSGFDPQTHNFPSAPKGTLAHASVNVGGNKIDSQKIFKRNITVSADSIGTTGYIVFYGHIPLQKVSIMVASPAYSDEEILKIIDGKRTGQVIKDPVYLR